MDFQPDVLAGFSAAPLGPATLIKADAQPASPRAAILHLHGYNDYFYQAEFGRWCVDQGLAFYAVDMRAAGRSLKPGDHAHDMANMTEPGDDIGAAMDALAELHPGLPLLIHAHSTGGLSAVIWAADRSHPQLAGMVLNSPLFGLPITKGDALIVRVVSPLMKLRPSMIVSRRPSLYNERLHVAGGGAAEFNQEWKTGAGVPTTARWVAAVLGAWKRIDDGLDLPVPTVVARSATTGPESDDNPLFTSQDVVVDTVVTARRTRLLGPRVEELVIEGGMHDLSQSAAEPRAAYLAGVAAFIDKVLG